MSFSQYLTQILIAMVPLTALAVLPDPLSHRGSFCSCSSLHVSYPLDNRRFRIPVLTPQFAATPQGQEECRFMEPLL